MIKMPKKGNLAAVDGSMMRNYLEFGDFMSAAKVFFVGFTRNYLLWNSFLEEFASFGGDSHDILEVFKELQNKGVEFDSKALTVVLKVCLALMDLWFGMKVHACLIKRGFHVDVHLSCALINLYEKCWGIDWANQVFDETPLQEDFLWNTIVMVNLRSERWENALELFGRMQSASAKATDGIIVKLLQACGKLRAFNEGKQIHGAVFDSTEDRDLSSWNSIISSYAVNGYLNDARDIFLQMNLQRAGFKPDSCSITSALQAVIELGYSMWGRSEEALAVINRIKSLGYTPNVVSWTAMISGCCQNENYMDALQFFSQMQEENVKPNSTTICSLLGACAGPSLLKKGEEIHCFSMRHGFVDDIYIATALIDMYSKGGKLEVAHEVFRNIKEKTLPCWNCMMMGYAIYGRGEEVFTLFENMCKTGIRPDAITFTALLSGCKNSCLVMEGWNYFDSMKKDYNISPTIEHYSCMVDLLGKAGFLDEALDFINAMPIKADASIWGALLAACRIHKDIKLAEIAARNLFRLEPYNSANYMLLMNIYSIFQRWDDVERLRESMTAMGVKISNVWSWTQVKQTIHVFSTEGNPHPEEGEIYFELYQLVSEIRKLGYVPDINCVHQNIDDKDKEKVLLSHTEKLAMTYGLMKVKDGSPIRVVKNTRICQDCHTAAKYISLARNRDIFLRDGGRFHHFMNGECSCNDRW
uniref:DYW domain-containing protein n=1 Tax=Cajanus cajan TaxID=3821 RepID=A0A151SMR2_CAJCA|nr:hypothetical protein KK1_002303 [Cajanus cajan]